MVAIHPSETFTKNEKKTKAKTPIKASISQQIDQMKQTYKSVKCNILYKLSLSSNREVYTLLSKNTIEEVKIFSPSVQGELWECPFCDPSRTVYKLNVPPEQETERMLHVKRLIRGHVELHRKDVLSRMMSEKEYEVAKAESIKRVHKWITGTIECRKLYRNNTLQNDHF
ncbi:unnamed protein product [Mucor fragilis]